MYSPALHLDWIAASMRALPRLFLLLILTLIVAGCGWLKPRNSTEYQKSRAAAPLVIPEGLDSPNNSAALIIPDTSSGSNQTEVADTPPTIEIVREPIAPVSSSLAPADVYVKVAAALRGTQGIDVRSADAATRTLKVNVETTIARRTWLSRLTGRDRVVRQSAVRTVSVLPTSGGSAVTILDAKGDDDASARRLQLAIRQALR